MNRAKRYLVNCEGQVYLAENKPALNRLLSKLVSCLGQVYGNEITIKIKND